ncbi:hypothetical protein GCM10009087_03160 [Sphingomonas oligophenolica]|uniref:DUF6894 domain-containing protein n=1 Tax=Sphingomonas oligophenolica TaxID=301154 RepID=A0ABU9Y0J6_9SPHN
MCRYFFHLVNDSSSIPDKEGQELANREAACAVARRTAGELIAHEVGAGRDIVHLTIMIDDEAGARVANLKAVANVVVSENPLVP